MATYSFSADSHRIRAARSTSSLVKCTTRSLQLGVRSAPSTLAATFIRQPCCPTAGFSWQVVVLMDTLALRKFTTHGPAWFTLPQPSWPNKEKQHRRGVPH